MSRSCKVLTISPNPAIDLSVALDSLQPGTVNRATSMQMMAAGKGVNMARVLVSLGHQVTVSGFLGIDNEAPFIEAFAALGVEDDFLRLPGATRINTKLSEAEGRVTDINAPGLAIDQRSWDDLIKRVEQQLQSPLRRPDAVMIGGSLPPGVAVEALAELIRCIRQHDLPVWVDTSGDALAAAVEAGASAVKPNREELSEWAATPLLDDDATSCAAQALSDRGHDHGGLAHTLVSLGAQGVLWLARHGRWDSRPPEVKVTNTVCAGDTLFAAMLHAVLTDMSPEDGLRLATALSAEAVRHPGVGDIHANDFHHLLEHTRVRRLSDAATGGAFV
ncbi:1-phosphofructokinase family hexose kinase [Halomonas huangheensis]|uniref:Phosphofructokinase n=1 Tax=Halomonas huangheensis TaxID=1178482 RepID=W1N8P0_9GAMM|nr:1-phosphofructokinase family hexose kinase [Halomonas huangheensis]ALM53478.1 1-phosphofructokinase [Halomonas huangheensis]ERL51844.1 hypothetical protein BJB45_11810 [Halomonas huangheensis]